MIYYEARKALFIQCIVTKFVIYKTNIGTSKIQNNKILCLLLHVST